MRRVLLVGLPAAGTSSVGEAVAALTGWPWLDRDLVLQRSTGHTAERLREVAGAAALRSAESDVLTLLLAMPPPLVAAVPEHAVLDRRDRERLRVGGHVVWVRAPVAVLARRLARQGRRLGPGEDPVPVLEAMAAEREPLLAEVATQVVDTDLHPATEAARQVVSAVGVPGGITG